MTVGFFMLVIPSIFSEMNGNPAIARMGIQQNLGSMEGKEVRFGPAASAYWAINTTVTSNGSVNAMHDSMMPLTGMACLLGMMVNSFYGGVGVGFLNFYIFIIIAVFISGLMVGRTPEFLGKKIEAKEVKIAMIIALLHPLFILTGTAIASDFIPITLLNMQAGSTIQAFTGSARCFTNSALPRQTMAVTLEDWATIPCSGMFPPVWLCCLQGIYLLSAPWPLQVSWQLKNTFRGVQEH